GRVRRHDHLRGQPPGADADAAARGVRRAGERSGCGGRHQPGHGGRLAAGAGRAARALVEGAVSSAGLNASFTVRRSERFTLRIRLSVLPGRTVALLGPNGAGKSTVVEAIAGLLPVDAGRIELAGVLLDCPERGVFVPP